MRLGLHSYLNRGVFMDNSPIQERQCEYKNLRQMTVRTHSAKRYLRLLPIITSATLKSFRGLPWSLSFNVTDRCPIGCNCYWRAQSRVREMDDDAVVGFFHQMRARGFLHAT